MAEKIEQWPADNERAIDPLERHSIERARVDPDYFAQHRDWYRWAEREVVKRDQDKERAERLEASNAEHLEALDSRYRARQADLQKREQEAEEVRVARNARLAVNVRRLP